MSEKIKPTSAFAVSPSWNALLLVCKDCRKRKDGPKQLKARDLAKLVKHEVKESALEVRVVLSTCLKLCPKRATSVAFVGSAVEPRIAAISSAKRLKENLRELIEVSKPP